MRPADLIINVRPRSAWEAIDLGFRLVQSTWRSLYLPWAIFLSLVLALVWLVFPLDSTLLASLSIWLLKPLYDRVLLHSLSYSLFDRQLSSADVFAALPNLIRRTGLGSALTWRRLSPTRSYTLPIWQLEGLRGEERKARQVLIQHQGHGEAMWLTFGCLHFEMILLLSLYGLLVLLDPTGTLWEGVADTFTLGSQQSSNNEYWAKLMGYVLHGLAVWLIEPFYVAAGFTLYLNRRTQLEAWDLEIAFRSLGERLKQLHSKPLANLSALLLASLLLVGMGTATFSPYSYANDAIKEQTIPSEEYLAPEIQPEDTLATNLETVMALPELSQTVLDYSWVLKEGEKSEEELEQAFEPNNFGNNIINGLAFALKSLLWIALGIAIILLLINFQKIVALLRSYKKTPSAVKQPDILFGLDIRPESLPEDIAAAAKQLWEKGQHREALSLLYRGALMILTRQDQVEINSSHTEGDILKLARPQLASERLQFLHTLTQQWQTIAYAHRIPAHADVMTLLAQWPQFKRQVLIEVNA